MSLIFCLQENTQLITYFFLLHNYFNNYGFWFQNVLVLSNICFCFSITLNTEFQLTRFCALEHDLFTQSCLTNNNKSYNENTMFEVNSFLKIPFCQKTVLRYAYQNYSQKKQDMSPVKCSIYNNKIVSSLKMFGSSPPSSDIQNFYPSNQVKYSSRLMHPMCSPNTAKSKFSASGSSFPVFQRLEPCRM